jgi:hypothetical protein
MILFLRNDKRETLVDIECFVKTEYEANESRKFVEINASVIIEPYSKFLLDNQDRAAEIIKDFSDISELRGWLWEKFFMGGDNDPEKYDEVIKLLREGLQDIAQSYKLSYVED